jgi:hypothetical protein
MKAAKGICRENSTRFVKLQNKTRDEAVRCFRHPVRDAVGLVPAQHTCNVQTLHHFNGLIHNLFVCFRRPHGVRTLRIFLDGRECLSVGPVGIPDRELQRGAHRQRRRALGIRRHGVKVHIDDGQSLLCI